MGQLANEVRAALEQAIEEAGRRLAGQALEQKLRDEAVDVTIPGRPPSWATSTPCTSPWTRSRTSSWAWASPYWTAPRWSWPPITRQAQRRRGPPLPGLVGHLLLRRGQPGDAPLPDQPHAGPGHGDHAPAHPHHRPGRVYRKDEVDATTPPCSTRWRAWSRQGGHHGRTEGHPEHGGGAAVRQGHQDPLPAPTTSPSPSLLSRWTYSATSAAAWAAPPARGRAGSSCWAPDDPPPGCWR